MQCVSSRGGLTKRENVVVLVTNRCLREIKKVELVENSIEIPVSCDYAVVFLFIFFFNIQ